MSGKDGLTRDLVVTSGADVYVPPFAFIKKTLGLSDGVMNGSTVTIPTEFFRFLMSSWLLRDEVDEAAYRKYNRDVDAEIKAGKLASAKEHYVQNGYYEDRAPRVYAIDADWYRRRYPDVAFAEKKAIVKDPQHHFNSTGRVEGRAGNELHFQQLSAWHRALAK